MNELIKQLDIFSDYSFLESEHAYFYKGNRVKKSVTQLVGYYHKKFDREYWSEYKAKKEGVSKEVILEDWNRKSELSTTTGTQFHSYMEHSLAGKIFDPKIPLREDINSRLNGLIPLADKFLSDSKHKLIPVKSEFIVGLGDKVAGQIDQIFWNDVQQELQIWDWKTSKSIDTENRYGDKMFHPLESFDDCSFIHYCLQVNIYKYLLESKGISVGKCYISQFHEDKDNYEIFECLDLQKEVEKILAEFNFNC